MSAGWIKLWRKAADNPYLQEYDVRGVFDLLLMKAMRKDGDVYCTKLGKVINLKRGQLWISPRDLTNKSTSHKRIRTILKMLEMGTLIGTDTGTGITIITVCNYDKYQSDDEPGAQAGAHRGAQTGHSRGTQNGEEGESREEKKVRKILCPPDPPSGGQGNYALRSSERFPKFEALPNNGSVRRYPDEFEAFWQAYPKRGSDTKKPAYASWRPKAKDPAIGVHMLQDAAERYASYAQRTGCETKLVSTWMSKEGWTASLEETPANRRNAHGRAKETVLDTAAKILERKRRREADAGDDGALAEDQAHHRPGGEPRGDLLDLVPGSVTLASPPDRAGVEPPGIDRGVVARLVVR